MNTLFRTVLLAAALAVLAACSKVNQENYAKIQNGMAEEEVHAILGSPDESTSREVLGIKGTLSTWKSGGAVITVRFVGGKVATKSFDKPPAQ